MRSRVQNGNFTYNLCARVVDRRQTGKKGEDDNLKDLPKSTVDFPISLYWTLLAYRTKNFYNLHKSTTKASKKNRPRTSNVSTDLNIIEKTDADIAVTDANDTH